MSLQVIGRRFARSFLAIAALLLLAVAPLSAQSDSSIGQGFLPNDESVVPGTLVALKDGSPNTVELASTNNLDQLLGVAGDESLIELSNGASGIQVVTSGNAAALVSDINGEIKTGDKITASPIAGVGMKAISSGLIIGTAQASLDKEDAETRTIKDKSGKETTILIAAIAIQVDKVYYEAPNNQNTFLPPAFQDFANSVAGKNVSPVRVMVAGMLVVLLFAAVVALLYAAVRSGIISIGRNPLSEGAVHKSLWQVGLTVLAVMVFTLAVIYLILTL